MKHTRIVWFLLVGILSLACVKTPEESVPEAQEYVTIQASLDASATKTYLDGVQVKWEASDSIAVWFGTLDTAMDDTEYKVASIGADARQATFQGFAVSSPDYMAVYPYIASKDCSKKGKLTVALPTVQPATAGGFAKNVNVAVAYSKTTELTFQNVGGLMAVHLEDVGTHTVKSIRLTGTAPLSGQVEIKKASLPAVDVVVAGENYVELSGTFAAGSTYYFVVLPGSHTGFTLTFTDDKEQVATATSAYAYTIARKSNALIADVNLSAVPWKTQEKVVLNEVQVNGDQFIELYNAGKSDEPLNGWQIFVNDSETPIWTGTTETLLPGGRTTVDCSGLATDKNTKLCLKNDSGEVKDAFIRGELGEGWGTITLPAANALASFSRVPDGTGAWKYAAPTPGAANGEKTGTIEQYPAANGVLVLNEINGNTKFIELYSTATDNKISLEDITIQYKGKLAWTGQAGYSIEPGGHVLLYGADVTKPGKAQEGYDVNLTFSTGLSAKSSIHVQLFDVTGASLDNFQRVLDADSPVEDSFARTPDGSGAWHIAAATPGTTNGPSTGDIPGVIQ